MKNKIKILVFDLDGTLLNNNSQLSTFTNNILLKCKKRKIKIFFLTGRATYRNGEFGEKIKVDGYGLNNGASLFINNKLINKTFIDTKSAQEIIRGLEENRFYICLHYDNYQMVTNHPLYYLWDNYSGTYCESLKYCSFNKIEKITIYNAKEIAFQKDAFLKYNCVCDYVKKNNIFTITNKLSNKAIAIQSICKYYSCPINEVVAFGDNSNDREMLNIVGLGIAVANADMETKRCADIILCKTNEEDGVAEWLESSIFK